MGASVCVVVGEGGGEALIRISQATSENILWLLSFIFFCFIRYSLLNTASKLAHTGMKRDGGEGVGRGVFTER